MQLVATIDEVSAESGDVDVTYVDEEIADTPLQKVVFAGSPILRVVSLDRAAALQAAAAKASAADDKGKQAQPVVDGDNNDGDAEDPQAAADAAAEAEHAKAVRAQTDWD